MGSARTITVANFITQNLYHLRDPNGNNYNKDGAYAELLGYINECNELIYEILTDENSDLICTGTGTVTTVAGTQSYDLSSNSMGDFWLPEKLENNRYAVWISEYEPMEMCDQNALYDAINANEGTTTSRSQPDRFCIKGDYIWFETVPDDAYTVNFRYFPNFVPLASTSVNMPYKNLFNNQIKEGVILYAKRRNELGIQIEAILQDMFLARALKIARKRTKTESRFTV